MRKVMKRIGAALAALVLCLAFPMCVYGAEALGEPTEGVVWPEQTIGVLPQPDAALPWASSFSVVIPAGFSWEEASGRYLCERWPLDAATITVDVTNLAMEERYTNAEKREMKERGEQIREVRRDYAHLTAADFEAAMAAAVGEGLTYRVKDFVHTTTKRKSDDTSFPGFRITAEVTGESRAILEEVHIVLSEDKIYTVTYAQASDDEFAELFKKSAATIAVY